MFLYSLSALVARTIAVDIKHGKCLFQIGHLFFRETIGGRHVITEL